MSFASARNSRLWLLFLVLTLTIFVLTLDAEAAWRRRPGVAAPVGTQSCVGCHIGWQDNNPPLTDVVTNNAAIDYFPLNFAPRLNSFYFIPEAYFGSIHSSPVSNPTATDYVTCEACHGSGAAHFGIGSIPNPIPQTTTCISCHNPVDVTFDSASFLQTAHANPNRTPRITFDQGRRGGAGQATLRMAGTGTVSLFKANDSPVTKSERIEECSVCHAYALQYPQFQKKIANGTFMSVAAEVGCGACHNAHIPAPNANTLESVAHNPNRTNNVVYLNHKPYKIDGTGAQGTGSTWVRGSAIARPKQIIISGRATAVNEGDTTHLTVGGGGLAGNVQPFYTVFITGGGLNRAASKVEEVEGDDVLVIEPQVPIAGGGPVEVDFEVRDMKTNTEDLCGSCHTQGRYKYTAKGATRAGAEIDLSSTHNNNITAQYRNSGHGDYQNALAWVEFSAFEYGSSHQPTYPFDMSLATGNPGRNNYSCNQCHHGLGSIDYQLNRHGTSDAQVLWGDATVTCITCHDPHNNGAGSNIRVPVMLSFSSRFTGGRTNRMLDGTAIPAGAGKGIICLFCHQGRESGFTVYRYILTRKEADEITVPDPYLRPAANLNAGTSSPNSHYLAGGALLWSKNAWEFFFDNVAQSYTNGNASHQTRNCAGCHMSEANAENTEGGHTWRPRIEACQSCHPGMTDFRTYPNVRGQDYDGDGTVETTAQEIDGLIEQINASFAAVGIEYNPSRYPYFFPVAPATSVTWTPNTLTASFNLNEQFKTVNALYVHNPMYTIQVLRDSLQAITGTVPPGVRPPGERPATDYRTITP